MGEDLTDHVTMTVEEAQSHFAEMCNGDYLMGDLLKKSGDLMRAVLTLHAEMESEDPKPKVRKLTFQGDSGDRVTLSRAIQQEPGLKVHDLASIRLTVSKGRVTNFSKG